MWSNFTFDPPSNCSETFFWSDSNNRKWTKIRIRRVHHHVIDILFEIPLLIHFHLYELNQKQVFGEFEGTPNAKFDHVIIYFENKFGFTKIEACISYAAYDMRHLTISFEFWTERKIGRPRSWTGYGSVAAATYVIVTPCFSSADMWLDDMELTVHAFCVLQCDVTNWIPFIQSLKQRVWNRL